MFPCVVLVRSSTIDSNLKKFNILPFNITLIRHRVYHTNLIEEHIHKKN